ncbi:Uncharacterised protein [Mycobacteroides abscessus]|nr:Uncharacterised protein [Mycobacteroides abscessus]
MKNGLTKSGTTSATTPVRRSSSRAAGPGAGTTYPTSRTAASIRAAVSGWTLSCPRR